MNISCKARYDGDENSNHHETTDDRVQDYVQENGHSNRKKTSATYIASGMCILCMTYTAHKKFMNSSTSAESMASFILEGGYLENQTS